MLDRFTPRYLRAFARLIGEEGGFVDDPRDRGGATKYGVSLRFALAEVKVDRSKLAQFDVDMDGDVDGQDIRKLTLDDAREIYFHHFWSRNACGALPEPIGEMVFDQAVNGGALAAKKLLQRAIRQVLHLTTALEVDGKIGPDTLRHLETAIKVKGVATLAAAYREVTKARYRSIVAADPSQARFLKGWLARAERLGR